jgi:hypothetical protein
LEFAEYNEEATRNKQWTADAEVNGKVTTQKTLTENAQVKGEVIKFLGCQGGECRDFLLGY